MTHPSRDFNGAAGLRLSAMAISAALLLNLLLYAYEFTLYVYDDIFFRKEKSDCEIEIHFFTFHWNQPAFLEAWAEHHSSILGSLAKNRAVVQPYNYRNLHIIDHQSTNLYALDVLARLQRLGAEVRYFSGPFTEKGRALSGWMRQFRKGQSSGNSRSSFLIPLDVDEFFLPRQYFCSEIQSISSPKINQSAWKPFLLSFKSEQSVGHKGVRVEKYQPLKNGPGAFVKIASAARIKMNSYVPKMWQWFSPSTGGRAGKAYIDLIRPKYQDLAFLRKLRNVRNPRNPWVNQYNRLDDSYQNLSRKTLFSSKFFVATDQGNHHGFVASDHKTFMSRNPETRNKDSPTSLHSELLHMSLLSWHTFQSKIMRAKEEYDFGYRLSQNGDCTGNGKHMCLEYMYFLQNGLISWKKNYVKKAIEKYW